MLYKAFKPNRFMPYIEAKVKLQLLPDIKTDHIELTSSII